MAGSPDIHGKNNLKRAYKVYLDEQVVDERYTVETITIEREINRIPTAIFEVSDTEARQDGTVDFTARGGFVPGTFVKITFETDGKEDVLFMGDLVKHNLRIDGGEARLVCTCYHPAFKMTLTPRSRFFDNLHDGDIIQQIAGEYGLAVTPDRYWMARAQTIQHQATDWDFMLARLEASGKVCLCRDLDIFLFGIGDENEGDAGKYTPGEHVFDFDAETDSRTQVGKVYLGAWSAADVAWDEHTFEKQKDTSQGSISGETLNNANGLDKYDIRAGSYSGHRELNEYAHTKMVYSTYARIRGTMKVDGSAQLKPNHTLSLEGFGSTFDGKAWISGIRHEIKAASFQTVVQFGVSAERFIERNNIHHQPALGLLPGVNGLQIGCVTAIEGDPDNQYRIRVKLPLVDNNTEGIWARMSNVMAGDFCGFFFVPDIGDEVVVGFLDDDPRQAIILGALYNGKKEPAYNLLNDNNIRGIMSRKNMFLEFDDEKTILKLETPKEKRIILNDDDDSIVLSDKHGNSIKMNADGIEITSSKNIVLKADQGDIQSSGLNIKEEAQIQFEAKGGGGAEVSTNAILVLKGSLVQIN